MSLTLYAHPLSSYCQKVLVAFYENGIAFDVRRLFDGDPEIGRDFAELWPIQRMPLLVDDGRTVAESTIIIEHLQRHHPGPVQLIPEDSLEVRFMDRVFDNYLQTPQQRIVFDALRPAEHRDPQGLSPAAAGPAQFRPRGRRSPALSAPLPAGRPRSGLMRYLNACA